MSRTKEIIQNAKALPKLLKVLLGVMLIPAVFVLLVAFGAFGPIPSRAELLALQVPTATELKDVHGELIGKYYIEERTEIPYESLAPNLVLALLATEDIRFFDHGGIDVS
ncbi:MAG: transglycosylase domain-containing protein, partial [Bacteroidota bacterium]